MKTTHRDSRLFKKRLSDVKQRTKKLKFDSLKIDLVVVEKFSGHWIDSKLIQIVVKNVPSIN